MKKTFCLAVCMLFMVVLTAGVALSGDKMAAEKTAVEEIAAEKTAVEEMAAEKMAAEEKAVEQMKPVLITGTINDANQLVDKDGQTFHVADNETGKKLLSHTGQNVQVTGTVMESEGKKEITVTAYEIMPEKAAH